MFSAFLLPMAMLIFVRKKSNYARCINLILSAVVIIASYSLLFLGKEATTYSVGSFKNMGFETVNVNSHLITSIFFAVFTLAIFFGWQLYKEWANSFILLVVYTFSNIIATCATDFFTLIFATELAGICVFFLICRSSIKSAIHYALMHSIGAILIMFAAAAFPSSVDLQKFVFNIEYLSFAVENLPCTALFLGLLIHCAAFPFSAWASDIYAKMDYSAMLLMASLSTKASLYLLCRFFAGSQPLLFVGMATIAYALLYVLRSSCAKKIAIYIMIAQIGGALVMMSSLSEIGSRSAFLLYLFASICLQLVLFISSWYADVAKITDNKACSVLQLAVLIGGLLSLSGAPFTMNFYAKSALHDYFNDRVLQAVNLLAFANMLMSLHFLCVFINSFKRVIFSVGSIMLYPWISILSVVLLLCCLPLGGLYNLIIGKLFGFALLCKAVELQAVFTYLEWLFCAFVLFLILCKIGLYKIVTKEPVDIDWFYQVLLPDILNSALALYEDLWLIFRTKFKNAGSLLYAYFGRVYDNSTLKSMQNSEFTLFIAILFINAYILIGLLGR